MSDEIVTRPTNLGFPGVMDAMTLEIATKIKQWRTVDNETWRGVAGLAYEQINELRPVIHDGNQIAGEELCLVAAWMLGERFD